MSRNEQGERVLVSSHLPQLDGLRAIAALIVVFVHWVHHGQILGTPWGDIGVQLFFVLSGFLITRILLMLKELNCQSTVRSLKQFYVRRALRIFPLYYTTILILAFLSVDSFRSAFAWHAGYFSNVYFYCYGFGGNGGHFWTLAVEEQFYTLFPLLVMVVPQRLVCPLILALVAMAPIYRFVAGSVYPLSMSQNYWLLLPSSLDSLCCGALLAWLERHKSSFMQTFVVRAMLWVGVGVYVCCELLPAIGVLKKSCVSFILSWVVQVAASRINGPVGRVLESRLLVCIGRYSYAIYVVHAFVPAVWAWFMFGAPIPGYRIAYRLGIPDWLFQNWYVERACWSVLTMALVVISYQFLERPLNNLKAYFPYKSPR